MPQYIVYLRVPYPRSDDEPAPVVWSHKEERQLWGELQRCKNDPDWKSLAKAFDVSVQYILQQAAWLYEKELKVLQRRMTQLNASSLESRTQDLSPTAEIAEQTPNFRIPKPSDTSSSRSGAFEEPVASSIFSIPSPTTTQTTPANDSLRFCDHQLLATTRDFSVSCEIFEDDDGDGFVLPDTSRLAQSDVSKSSDGSLTRSALEEAFNQREARTTASSGTASNFEP